MGIIVIFTLQDCLGINYIKTSSLESMNNYETANDIEGHYPNWLLDIPLPPG